MIDFNCLESRAGGGMMESTVPSCPGVEERRSTPRIYEPFFVNVSGIDRKGEDFGDETYLDNLSAGGLYVRIPRDVEPGAKLSFVVCMSHSGDTAMVPRIAAKGIVIRSEPKDDGSYGIGVALTQHRFLYSPFISTAQANPS